MKDRRSLMVFVLVVLAMGIIGQTHAGDWKQAPIKDLDGLLNARTEEKKPTMMEVGRGGGVDGHPSAYAELEVECEGDPHDGDRFCNIQLDILFSKPKGGERVVIQVLDDDSIVMNTAYLQRRTSDNTMARVYVVGAKGVEGVNPVVRVGIQGTGEPIRGTARVTFMKALFEKEDKTNWQVASNHPMYDEDGRRLERPNFLFQGN